MKNKRVCYLGYSLIIALIVLMIVPGCLFASTGKGKAVFADQGFDSIMTHNRIAGFILKHGYGFEPEYLMGESITALTGIGRGDIDVFMECWVDNYKKAYDKALSTGAQDLGSNFPDSWQGWLVPTYVIKGDPKRGIKPLAPDLKSVYDLVKYWKVFQDPEDPTKGAFISCIPGWGCQKINGLKLTGYGLDKYFNAVVPGSDAALSGSMFAAYQKGKPWVGYYWAPTWVLGKLDMTPLEEPPYDPTMWNDDASYACAYPSVKVNILVSAAFAKRAPEAIAFLKKYETTLKLNNTMLAHMKDTKARAEQTAVWFLKTYGDLWEDWVTPAAAKKIKKALK